MLSDALISEARMKASMFYRIASVLLLLFAAGHTFGFRQNIPEWGTDAVLALMRSVHFGAQGFTRTYWDFFSALGLFSPCFFCPRRYWRGCWAEKTGHFHFRAYPDEFNVNLISFVEYWEKQAGGRNQK